MPEESQSPRPRRDVDRGANRPRRDVDRDNAMGMQLRRVVIETPKRRSRETTVQIDPEDFVAIFAAFIALCFTLSIVAGWLELNKLSAGVVTLSGTGAGVAQIIKARKKERAGEKGRWLVGAIVVTVLVACAAGAIFFWLR